VPTSNGQTGTTSHASDAYATQNGHVEIVVRGRHLDLSTRFRDLVKEKLAKVERLDGKCHRIDVEVSQETNPRRSDDAVRLELTCHGKGPVIRAEASAADKYGALDAAYTKLEERLRRAADRRRDRSRGRARTAVPVTAVLGGDLAETTVPAPAQVDGLVAVDGDGPLVVREKTHRAEPLTLDQALEQMELVGHDFYLFHDVRSDLPSVVYRRRGYDYGVIHLSAVPGGA
jgi:ribosomal subunit interface protein